MKIVRDAAGNRMVPLSAKEIARLAELLMDHRDNIEKLTKLDNTLVKRFVLYDHLDNRR